MKYHSRLADKYTFTIAKHSKMNHWDHTTAIKQWPTYSTRRPPCSTTRKETGCLWRQAAVLYYQAGFIIISEITKKTAEPIAQHSFIKMFKYMSYHPFTSFFFLWGQNELAPILNAFKYMSYHPFTSFFPLRTKWTGTNFKCLHSI